MVQVKHCFCAISFSNPVVGKSLAMFGIIGLRDVLVFIGINETVSLTSSTFIQVNI